MSRFKSSLRYRYSRLGNIFLMLGSQRPILSMADIHSTLAGFREILSQNWGMKFCSYDFIFMLFPNILASKAQKTINHVSTKL